MKGPFFSDLVFCLLILHVLPIGHWPLSRDGIEKHLLLPSLLVSRLKTMKFVKPSFVYFPSFFLGSLGLLSVSHRQESMLCDLFLLLIT